MWRPGKSFRVGAMRHRITVQNYTETQDGAGQKIPTWADLLTDEPARFYDVGGGTSYRGQQLQENVVAIFEVRYRTGYDTTQKVIFDSQEYGITRVSRVDGGNRYLALFCKGVVA